MRRWVTVVGGVAILLVVLLARAGCDEGVSTPDRPIRVDPAAEIANEPVPPGESDTVGAGGVFPPRRGRNLRVHGRPGDLPPDVEITVTHRGDPVAGAEIRLGPVPPRVRASPVGGGWPGVVHVPATPDFTKGKRIGETDATGVFRGRIEHGHYLVLVRSADYSNGPLDPPTLTTGWAVPTKVTVPVERILSIRGRCLGEGGRPLPGFWIQAAPRGGGKALPLVRTDEHGAFTIPNVFDLPHRVRAVFPRGLMARDRLFLPYEELPIVYQDAERRDVYPARDFVEFQLRRAPVTEVRLYASRTVRGGSPMIRACRYADDGRRLQSEWAFWMPREPREWSEARFPVPQGDLSDYLAVRVSGFAPAWVRTTGGAVADVDLRVGRRIAGSVIRPEAKDSVQVYAYVDSGCVAFAVGIGVGKSGEFTIHHAPELPIRLALLRKKQRVCVREIPAGVEDLAGVILKP